MDIPRTNAPFSVQLGSGRTLSGNECIEIAQTLEKLRAQGLDSTDSRYAALLSLFNIIVQQAQRTKLEEQNRQREPTNTGTSSWTQQQYSQFVIQIRCLKYLLERKLLPPQLVTCFKHFNSNNSNNNSNLSNSVSNDEKSSWELSPAEKEKEKEKLLIKSIVERTRDPSTILIDTITEEYRPMAIDLNMLKLEQKRHMSLKMAQRKNALKARMEEFKKNRSRYSASTSKGIKIIGFN